MPKGLLRGFAMDGLCAANARCGLLLSNHTRADKDVRRLYKAANLPEAYIVVAQLRAAGVEARVFNENAQGGLGELPFTHVYPEVWVMDDSDWTRARDVVTAYEGGAEANAGVSVHCPDCREENPGNFQLCWNCGATLK